jgi:dTDP-D-glucose 4,6-dehydratase
MRPEELHDLKGDSTKLRDDLNWVPKYTFETMLDEMVKYWLDYYYEKYPYLKSNWTNNGIELKNLDI